MTIVHDEAFFLPIWLTYYSRFFAPDDIYVLDHDTTDGSTDRPGFHRLPVSHDGVDHRWMRDTVSALQRELQQTYDVVLFTDVDEIVAFDPDLGDLGQFIDRFRDPFVQCVGHEIIHRPDREPPFDPARPVLEQRSWWFANAAYNKPLLATEPLDWVPGFHGVENAVERRLVDLDTNLHLFHLHRLDFERCRQRHALRRTRRWDARRSRSRLRRAQSAGFGRGIRAVVPPGRTASIPGPSRSGRSLRVGSTYSDPVQRSDTSVVDDRSGGEMTTETTQSADDRPHRGRGAGRVISDAESLEAAGRFRDAIELLSEANRDRAEFRHRATPGEPAQPRLREPAQHGACVVASGGRVVGAGGCAPRDRWS